MKVKFMIIGHLFRTFLENKENSLKLIGHKTKTINRKTSQNTLHCTIKLRTLKICKKHSEYNSV